MSMTTDPAKREAFIAGLRELADFLALNPQVAFPRYSTSILVSARHDSADAAQDGDERRFVDEFAAQTGGEIEDRWAVSGHYTATARFGPIEYKAAAISKPAMDAHKALQTYQDCVQPAAEPGELGEAA